MINMNLALQRDISAENISKINDLQSLRQDIFTHLHLGMLPAIPYVAGVLTAIEFKLQELWGFDKDIKFHRFWLAPKCTCAIVDNEDAYPSGYYYINADCPLHGNGE